LGKVQGINTQLFPVKRGGVKNTKEEAPEVLIQSIKNTR